MILNSSGAMRFIRLLFVFALLSMPDPMPVDAQHCIIRDFGEDDGLAHWHVTSMLQDHYGILWFGTWNGLERFDGETFTLFKSHPATKVSCPTTVYATSNWAETTASTATMKMNGIGSILLLAPSPLSAKPCSVHLTYNRTR